MPHREMAAMPPATAMCCCFVCSSGALDCCRAASVLTDPRDTEPIRHSVADMLKQRVFALCQGYEDLNEHGELRRDVLLQTAVERDTPPLPT